MGDHLLTRGTGKRGGGAAGGHVVKPSTRKEGWRAWLLPATEVQWRCRHWPLGAPTQVRLALAPPALMLQAGGRGLLHHRTLAFPTHLWWQAGCSVLLCPGAHNGVKMALRIAAPKWLLKTFVNTLFHAAKKEKHNSTLSF